MFCQKQTTCGMFPKQVTFCFVIGLEPSDKGYQNRTRTTGQISNLRDLENFSKFTLGEKRRIDNILVYDTKEGERS
ncbi:unnamed protein product [Allacma fusca]|uniref:Uncharacterized protein n=1 Tax=Allacma fusca TaxID=39272 RepID=A0A8J2JPP4_9HEXA|nr:unnamed protein product [Allacma fusca]